MAKHLIPSPPIHWTWMDLVAVLVLWVVASLPFLQLSGFEFLNYDDPLHIAAQPVVLSGVNTQSVAWAMTATPSNLWHPVTWMSYMAEVSWFGGGADAPGVHHLGNLLFHLSCSGLFFILLRTLRISTLVAALVALLFSLHPLHVEPVAWISSRKDVLYACWAMASLCCYQISCYQISKTKSQGVWFGLTLMTLAAALASKPSAVVLPVLFILLDMTRPQDALASQSWLEKMKRQVKHKWSYFLIAGVAAVMAIYFQYSGSHSRFIDQQSLWARLSYLPASIGFYLQHSIFPRNLTFEYAHPVGVRMLVLSSVGGSSLVALGYLGWRSRGRSSIGLVAGLWFLVCLAPVLGFFYVGGGFTSDRYAYLAIAGPAIALAVYLQSLEGGCRKIMMMIGSVCILFFGLLSYQQTRVWKNDVNLFTYGVATEPRSGTAQTNLATLYRMYGKDDLALAHYQKALRLNASYYIVNYNMAQIYHNRGEHEQAIEACRRSLESNPDYARSHHLLGSLLERPPNLSDDGLAHFQRACQLMPSNAKYVISCAEALARREQFTKANMMIQQALQNGSPQSPDYQKLEAMQRKLVPYIRR